MAMELNFIKDGKGIIIYNYYNVLSLTWYHAITIIITIRHHACDIANGRKNHPYVFPHAFCDSELVQGVKCHNFILKVFL